MGYIFETEIGTIMNAVRARTIGESESIRLMDIQVARIHPAIKAYFRNEVEKLLQQERQKEVRSKRLPYGLAEVLNLQEQIDIILIQRYQFTQEEFESLLDQAVHFEFNYLCRPRWTLMNFVFEERRTMSASEVYRKLRYCIDYIYFPRIIKRYIADRGLAEVTYEDFKRVVDLIDDEVIAQHDSAQLANLMRPMLAFVEAGFAETPHAGERSMLPINAAVVFVEDKNLLDLKEALEYKRDIEGVNELTLPELADVIGKVRAEPAGEEALTPETPVTAEDVIAAAEEGAAEDEMLAPVLEQPVEESLDLEGATGEAEAERRDGAFEDLFSLFTLKDQKLFVKKIFRKDEVGFRNAIERLNGVTSWEDASAVLDEIFQANNVDPFSKEAVRFTDLLHDRFHPASADEE